MPISLSKKKARQKRAGQGWLFNSKNLLDRTVMTWIGQVQELGTNLRLFAAISPLERLASFAWTWL
jgi:hypothetical protein